MKGCKMILVDNYHLQNQIENYPCINIKNIKSKHSIGVWRIKSNG